MTRGESRHDLRKNVGVKYYDTRMARITGRDIILQLIETTNELKSSMKAQGETMRAQGETMRAQGETMRDLGNQMRDLSNQMRDMSGQMASNVTQFGRIAKLLGVFAKTTDERFEEVEHRLSVLESAHG